MAGPLETAEPDLVHSFAVESESAGSENRMSESSAGDVDLTLCIPNS